MPSVLNRPILKLNKHWQAIESTTARQAFISLWQGKAKVLHTQLNDKGTFDICELYAFQEWMKQSIGEDDRYVQTTSGRIKLPSIIICNEYDQDPNLKRKVIYSRRNIFRRDNGFCQFCGKRLKGDDWEIDHVIPRSKGGNTGFTNCVCCCTACNRKKADRTPREAGMELIRTVRKNGKLIHEVYDRPHKPIWSPIYSISHRQISRDWEVFLKGLISDIYWDMELEED